MKFLLKIMIVFFIINTNSSFASVVIGATRVVFPENLSDVTLSVKNTSTESNFLVQSWIEGEIEEKQNAFTITPPILKIKAEQNNLLRIIKINNNFPQDRESLYYINIKSIEGHEKSEGNKLNIAFVSRIKLFHRPVALQEGVSTAHKKLQFSVGHKSLLAKNPTPYYLSFSSLKINNVKIESPGMIAPFSEIKWDISDKPNTVSWSIINDYGGESTEESRKL